MKYFLADRRGPASTPAEAQLAAVNRWLSGRRPRTAREYANEWRRFLAWWRSRGGSATDWLAVGPAEAREYATALGSSLGPAGQNRSLSAMSSLWASIAEEAQARGLELSNPWRPGVTRRPAVRHRVADRILSEAEVRRLLRVARAGRERALVLLLYDTLLRIEEAITARWSDIRPTEHGYAVTVMGKGGKTRTTGISLRAVSALRPLRRPGVSWILPGNGAEGHIAETTGERIVRRIAERCGIREAGPHPWRPVSPHWLRHSGATHALHHGADLATLRDSLGHSDLRTTSQYLHAQPGKTATDYIPGADRRLRSGPHRWWVISPGGIRRPAGVQSGRAEARTRQR